ncbi:MAG: carbamoyltransferase HypF [Acidobacteria bacterium]|nr:carbamoyltransferase HypF [Acidobacteriota bacterium]
MQTERHAAVREILHRESEHDSAAGWSRRQLPLFDSSLSSACPIPDRPICASCEEELTDSANRRFDYPFISCNECGPRHSILHRGPYTRANTSMAPFSMCEVCLEEYRTPGNRRFHDEATSCPACGPTLRVKRTAGTTIGAAEPLRIAVRAIGDGSLVALRDERRDSILCDATSTRAVARLRARYGLVDVPLVVMVRDLDEASRVAELDARQRSLLTSVERPVVLVSIRTDSPLPGEVATGNRLVGLLLPYTSLHHLLLKKSGRPLVILPAGVPDPPQRTNVAELLGDADLVLVADRSEACHVPGEDIASESDSHSARRIRLSGMSSRVILACGAASPGAVCLVANGDARIELATGSYGDHHVSPRFEESIERVESPAPRAAEVIAHDLDTRLDSTRFALDQHAVPRVAVQQHHAQLAACLSENSEAGTALGVVFDFGGLGSDGTVWGGELLRGNSEGIERLATFRPIALAGEHVSTRQIWRVALAMIDEVFRGKPPLHALPLFRSIPRRGIDVVRRVVAAGPTVSSHAIGLHLEALAAIILDRQDSPWPGALVREWESIEDRSETGRYPLVIRNGAQPWEIDFRPVVENAVAELISNVPVGTILARAGNSVVAAVVEVLRSCGAPHVPVAITGELFEGTRFADRIASSLGDGAMVLRPKTIPAGPGAIALGQVIVADALMRKGAPIDAAAQDSRLLTER